MLNACGMPLQYLTVRMALAAVLVMTIAGCGTASSEQSGAAPRLTVSAASSLQRVLPKLGPNERFQFAGSDQLALQIREGASVDVYAAANSRLPHELHDAKLVEKPVPFATNRVVLVVPAGSKIRSLADLSRARSARIVMADAGVPLGDYTRDVLRALGRDELVDRAASFERDAAGVTGKVATGEADAGLAYVTDIASANGRVRAVELPATPVNVAVYEAAIVRSSHHHAAAVAFLRKLTSPEGRAALVDAGFGVPAR